MFRIHVINYSKLFTCVWRSKSRLYNSRTFISEGRNVFIISDLFDFELLKSIRQSLKSSVPFDGGGLDLSVCLCLLVSTLVEWNGPRLRRPRDSSILVKWPLKLFNDLRLILIELLLFGEYLQSAKGPKMEVFRFFQESTSRFLLGECKDRSPPVLPFSQVQR